MFNNDNYEKRIEWFKAARFGMFIHWGFSYGDMRAEKWRAQELIGMIHRYHPDVIIDNRLEVSGEGFGSLTTANPTDYSSDFVSPEQVIPPNGLQSEAGEPLI